MKVSEQTPKPNQPSLKEEKTDTRKFSDENPVTRKSPTTETPTGGDTGEDRTFREAHPCRQLRETPHLLQLRWENGTQAEKENPVTGRMPASETPTSEDTGEDRNFREAHHWRQLRETPTYYSRSKKRRDPNQKRNRKTPATTRGGAPAAPGDPRPSGSQASLWWPQWRPRLLRQAARLLERERESEEKKHKGTQDTER